LKINQRRNPMINYLSIDEYMRRPYSRVLIPDADTGTYTAEVAEFPGCVAQGDSPKEAYEALEEVAREWLAATIDAGKAVPDALAENEYSGRIALRLPRSLHKQAAECAQFEETSLNQFLVAATAEKVGASKMYQAYACKFEAYWRPTVTLSATVQILNVDLNAFRGFQQTIFGGALATTPASASAVLRMDNPPVNAISHAEERS
jgi:predicted RNase H-like HicB family nuclease